MAEDTDANIPAELRSSWRDRERRRLADMKAGTIDSYVVEYAATAVALNVTPSIAATRISRRRGNARLGVGTAPLSR